MNINKLINYFLWNWKRKEGFFYEDIFTVHKNNCCITVINSTNLSNLDSFYCLHSFKIGQLFITRQFKNSIILLKNNNFSYAKMIDSIIFSICRMMECFNTQRAHVHKALSWRTKQYGIYLAPEKYVLILKICSK